MRCENYAKKGKTGNITEVMALNGNFSFFSNFSRGRKTKHTTCPKLASKSGKVDSKPSLNVTSI